MDSPVIGVAIGIVFVFATLSVAVSALTEAVSRFLGLRGEYLLRGIRTMLDGGGKFKLTDLSLRGLTKKEETKTKDPAWVSQLMNHDLVNATADKGDMPGFAGNAALNRKERRKVPSYLSSRTFARALIDVVVQDAQGKTTITGIRKAVLGMDEKSVLKKRLLVLVRDAGNDLDRFRLSLEQWYDDQMARVSGWYKRHVRWISFAIGLVLIVAINLSLVAITRAFYTDQVLRESVVTQAVAAGDCGQKTPQDCLAATRAELEKAKTAGLPIGWGTVPACVDSEDCSWAEKYGLADPTGNGTADAVFLLLVALGYLGMLVALVPGSRFWFDLLKKMGSLRETGPTPGSS